MDLNSQYFRHQRALMRAAASGCSSERQTLLGHAAGIARSIASHQHQLGASASTGWSLMA